MGDPVGKCGQVVENFTKSTKMGTSVHCPKCASENVVFSKKRGAYVCEDCGDVLPEAPVAPLRIFLSYTNRRRAHLLWSGRNSPHRLGELIALPCGSTAAYVDAL